MERMARAMQDGPVLKQAGDRVYRDVFRIPEWLYDEVVQDEQFKASPKNRGNC